MSDLRKILVETITSAEETMKNSNETLVHANCRGKICAAKTILHALNDTELYITNDNVQVRYNRSITSTGDDELDAMLMCKETIADLLPDARIRVADWLSSIARGVLT